MKLATDLIKERLESMKVQKSELLRSIMVLEDRIKTEIAHTDAINEQINQLEAAIKTLEG